jgi:hypothetical protein
LMISCGRDGAAEAERVRAAAAASRKRIMALRELSERQIERFGIRSCAVGAAADSPAAEAQRSR